MIDFTFMAAPLGACLLLPLIFTYFGIHVLKREIIFVDLALAQLAALGSTVAFVWDLPEESFRAQLISFVCILSGAGFFSFARKLQSRVPQEAIIGIVYIVGSAVAILFVSHHYHGAEHIKTLLNGSILWMSWNELFVSTGIALLTLVFFRRYHSKFLQLSQSYKETSVTGKNQQGWDFLFYLILGTVIVFFVKTAGIYLIFTLLIVPAVCSFFFLDTFKGQFLFGGGLGIVTCVSGMFLSYGFDLPTGSAIVGSFGMVFIICLITYLIKKKKEAPNSA